MQITYDRSHIRLAEEELISHGYARERLYSLHFRYILTEEQKAENLAYSKAVDLGSEAWNNYIAASAQQHSKHMEHIAAILEENFKVAQYDDRDDAPYISDWDLLFWCNDFAGTMRGLLEGRDYAHFTLSFNGQHDPERREKIYNRILRILELFSDDGNLRVTVQYDAMMDDARIKRDAKLAAPRIIGQNCIYEGMEGRVEANGDSLFFRRKRARKHVYCLTDAQILSISWQLSPPEEDSI